MGPRGWALEIVGVLALAMAATACGMPPTNSIHEPGKDASSSEPDGSSSDGVGAQPEWEIRVDPAQPGLPISRALLGQYDLSGALLHYDQVPGLATALAPSGFSEWRVGV